LFSLNTNLGILKSDQHITANALLLIGPTLHALLFQPIAAKHMRGLDTVTNVLT